jgi:GDPmannose 4,6-dehydratase
MPSLDWAELDLLSPDSIRNTLDRVRPAWIFHLGGKTSVAETWKHPDETMRTNVEGTLAILEAMRDLCPAAHLVFAGSGDCFDHAASGVAGITPQSPLQCTNVYAVSKAAAMECVRRFRDDYGLRASVAVLMNHTSPRRPNRFVEKKIVHEAAMIARGELDQVVLGSLQTRRDWAWAQDVVEGLALLAARPEPGDYLFASGRTHTTEDWVRLTFDRLKLDPQRHLRIDPACLHPGDRPHTHGNIEATRLDLGWEPQTGLEQMVVKLLESERSTASQANPFARSGA